MSAILDTAARLDPIRSRDLDLTDAEMGYAACERFEVIPVTGEPFMVSPVRQDIQVAMLKGAIRG
jgi:hypothetical protein